MWGSVKSSQEGRRMTKTHNYPPLLQTFVKDIHYGDVFPEVTRFTYSGGVYQCIPGGLTLSFIIRLALVIG
jgi:hypothetical protein